MSWDIYGQPLRHGFCEVHPDVSQPYPCEMCLRADAEYSRYRSEREEYERAQEADYLRHLQTEYEAEKFEAGVGHA